MSLNIDEIKKKLDKDFECVVKGKSLWIKDITYGVIFIFDFDEVLRFFDNLTPALDYSSGKEREVLLYDDMPQGYLHTNKSDVYYLDNFLACDFKCANP